MAVKKVSDTRRGVEGVCVLQEVQCFFPTGDGRDLDEGRDGRYARLFAAKLMVFFLSTLAKILLPLPSPRREE